MTKQTRRKFSAEFKAKVALEAIKNSKTLAQLSQQFDVNIITISKWKTEALSIFLRCLKAIDLLLKQSFRMKLKCSTRRLDS